MLNKTATISHPFLIGFKTAELVATMCALAHFVHESKTFSGSADESLVDIAESLIIRLQDVLDEDQIRSLCGDG